MRFGPRGIDGDRVIVLSPARYTAGVIIIEERPVLRVAVVARQGEVYEEDAVASRERRVADVARHVPEVEEEKLDPIGGGDGRIRDECRGDEQSKYPHARRALAFGTLSRPYQLLAQVRYRAGA